MISLSLIALLPVNGTSYSPPEMVERADVAPAYIANQTIVIELYGEYDVANIPQTGDINYFMQILSIFNGSVIESANATELNANWFYYYFNGIPAGFYYFYAYFTFPVRTNTGERTATTSISQTCSLSALPTNIPMNRHHNRRLRCNSPI